MTLLERVKQDGCILLQQEAEDWQQAVRLGCELLQEKGFVTADYYTAILNHTAEYGPYYVLAPGFAMPHARPEDGALKTGFCLVTLRHPVVFGEKKNDPVDVIVILVAKDKKEMDENSIFQVMEFIGDQDLMNRIRNIENILELYQSD